MIFGHDIGTWEQLQVEVDYLVKRHPHLSAKDISNMLQIKFGSRPTKPVLTAWIARAAKEATQ